MYPSLYYAFRDLFGLDWPALKMIQSFGFFVAISFLLAAYFFTKELKRKELQGLVSPGTIKVLKGAKATPLELATSALIGFLIGYKLVFVALNFTAFTENTQGFLLSTQGNFIGGIFGALISAYFKYREKEKTKLPIPELVDEVTHPYQHVGTMTLIAAFAGLLGAKIFHNLENWDEFMVDPVHALISFDGLTMYGGLICGSAAVVYYAFKNKIPIPHLIDSCAPGLMLAYGTGRIGCHVAGDGDWGIVNIAPKPFWLSWAPDWLWSYDYPNNVNGVGELLPNCYDDRYCHHLVPSVFPTAMYESIICISLFLLLWILRKRFTIPGVMFSVYLILNGMERFFIEKIRVNTLYHIGNFGFTQAELISTILFLLGVTGVVYFTTRNKKITSQNASAGS